MPAVYLSSEVARLRMFFLDKFCFSVNPASDGRVLVLRALRIILLVNTSVDVKIANLCICVLVAKNACNQICGPLGNPLCNLIINNHQPASECLRSLARRPAEQICTARDENI